MIVAAFAMSVMSTAAVTAPAPSAGAPQRTFVASYGSDAATCTRQDPCRNFLAAINAVAAGGEVIVLDSAGYGSFSIAKSVTVAAPSGVYAGVTGLSGFAVTIAAADTDSVTLRGLTVNSLGASLGILGSARDIHIENCQISGFNSAISIQPATISKLYVRDSTLRNNFSGLFVAAATGGLVIASVDHVRSDQNIVGFYVSDNSRVTITDSIAAGNQSEGFKAEPGPESSETIMTLSNCTASANGTGVNGSGATTIVRVTNSTITGNTTGFAQDNGAVFETLGTNLVLGNTTHHAGTITPASLY